ncbi:hypothetical protein XENOCAPTIV_019691, partial [Xenoophorus captivus]
AQTSFTFELPNHRLCFQSKVSPVDMSTMSPSASLSLPPVTMSGEYIMEDHESHSDQSWAPDDFPAKQGNYLQGNYLRCVAEVRTAPRHGGEQPIPLWNEHDTSTDADKPKILLYSLSLMFKGIQMTATTPSMRAVRFETGLIELELSNRIQCKAQPGGNSSYLKLFGKCQVDLNLALGQIVKHQVMDKHASAMRSASETISTMFCPAGIRRGWLGLPPGGLLPDQDRSTKCPAGGNKWLIRQGGCADNSEQADCFCPASVLFWLNYKAAYDDWNEQRLALNNDIHMATKEVVDKLPGIQQTSAQAFSTLFLQLTVNDLGICLPITNASQGNHSIDFDTGSALVLTIESTQITACSSESLVSKGHFKNFCIRFAEGFETSWDDWKPEVCGDLVMNACEWLKYHMFPDIMKYEIMKYCLNVAPCVSRIQNINTWTKIDLFLLLGTESSSAGTWTLNVLWKMCGIDVHMDPNIGKRLNALGNTLTSLTGEEDVDDATDLNSVTMEGLSDEDETDTMSPTIHTVRPDLQRSLKGLRPACLVLPMTQVITPSTSPSTSSCCCSQSSENQFSPRLTLKRRLVNHILGLSPRPQSVSENMDPRRQMMGNQVIDARGRKVTKRVVDIRELNEQAKVIDDLKKLGASEGTINQEIQRYQQLESVAVQDIRRDVRKKLRRSSMRVNF